MRVDMTVNSAEAIKYRCYLDGVDISNDCWVADDEEGWADCYVFENGTKLRSERHHGDVRLILKEVPVG